VNTPQSTEDLLRQERRQFKHACISSALALLIYAGVVIFVKLNNGKVASMTAAGTFSALEIHRQELQSMIALEFGGLGILLCGLVMARSLAKWLLAIRRRRKVGSGLPPSA
jgi:hypothetical protein